MNLKINVLPKESTAQLLAESLRQSILQGQLKPGIRLVEQELAEQIPHFARPNPRSDSNSCR